MTPTTSTNPPGLQCPDTSDIGACIRWVDARYLKNRRDEEFMLALKDILAVDQDGQIIPEPTYDPLTEEVKGLIVIGESGDGKTTLIRRNLGALACIREVNDDAEGNFLHVKIDNEPTVKALAKQLLEKTGYRQIASSTKGDDLWRMLRHRIENIGIKLVWIDEAHHLFNPGPGRDIVSSLRAIKSLMQGERAPAVILAGVPELHGHLIRDRETKRRFFWHRLKANDLGAEDFTKLRQFIDQCCIAVGLEAPTDEHYAERLLFAENGSLGNALYLAKQSVRRALINRRPGLDLESTRVTFERMKEIEGMGPFAEIEWPKLRGMLIERGWS